MRKVPGNIYRKGKSIMFISSIVFAEMLPMFSEGGGLTGKLAAIGRGKLLETGVQNCVI